MSTTPIRRVLIANRGEIAHRIIRTCARMGIETVAVFSDADADAVHVKVADKAVRIGPAPSLESYLLGELIIEAALLTGADAIHPGYGFLSENAGFAAACAEAGVTFIGPTPEVIEAMGKKIEAKNRVTAAGVPVVPGYNGDEGQDDATLLDKASAVGFPLLVKASAGGGGKGMRVVRRQEDLATAIAAARREAQNAFGDDALMLERYVQRPRHVEIQILGDAHGNVVHLAERECSIQRRHQKVIEESPSPALDPQLRAQMGAAAVAVGTAIGYTNAGTVEFILDQSGAFFFLEVNTRLQVEHPVTEMVMGVDLVREQIRVAEGQPLGYAQGDLSPRGAAVECRLYAEDPDGGYLPSTGTLRDFHLPQMEGVRLDSGVERGSEVSVHYDPMLAKIITHAPTRVEATRLMVKALRSFSVQGVKHNLDFLTRVLTHPAYVAGDLTTHFLEEHAEDLAKPVVDTADAVIAATLATYGARLEGRPTLPGVRPGFRNNRVSGQRVRFGIGETVREVSYTALTASRLAVSLDGADPIEATIVSFDGATLVWEAQATGSGLGLRRTTRVIIDGDTIYTHGEGGSVRLSLKPRFPVVGVEEVAGACVAPMPGKVIQVLVSEGQAVQSGQTLLILEAMKMEQPVLATQDGEVVSVHVKEGDQVDVDALLVVLGE